MHYSYKSNGIVSRSISDYRDNLLSDFSTFRVWEGDKEFTEGQYLTKRISDVNYGTVGNYGSEGINSRSKGSGVGSDIQMASGGILIVGERGTSRISGSAECFAKYMPYSPITYGPNGETYYRYESGTKYETVGQHGPSVINQGIGLRTLASFTFIWDHYTTLTLTGAAESRVYNYHPDEVEEYNELDYGLISANHTNSIDNGSITTYPASQEDRGFILDGYKTRSGFLRFTDKAAYEAAVFKYLGSGSIRKWGEQQSPSIYGYITDGKVRSLTVHGTADVDFSPASYGRGVLPLRGTSAESFGLEYSGSGSFKKFSGAVESITWNPEERQMLFSFIGVGSERQTDNYLGTGLLHTFSGAAESRTASDDIAAGLFRVGGSGHSSETDTYIGSGVFSTFSGLSESTTWNPDEKQMLFSFTGAVQNVEHHRSYVGDGRLFNFFGGEEKQSFAHVGSGVLYLKPRKPVTYELRELANLTLDTAPDSVYWLNTDAGDNTYGWNGPTKIGQVYLKDLNEKDHEKFSVVYDQGAFVEFVRKDYGSLVQTSLTNCVANSGTISTNTTATSGCIKVAPGTTLAIAPSNTYTIPNLLTTPSVFEDYGSVANFNAPEWRDYGWILDTSDLRTPYGLGIRFTSQVDVNVNHIYDWTSTGEGYGGTLLRFIGDTVLPLDVAEYGSGNLFSMGGAAEVFASDYYAEGLWRFVGDSHETRRRVFVGSGRIPVFKGAAESTTWNPEERQMLFDFTGVGTEKHTEVFVGSGNLFNFSGASESSTYSPDAFGLFKITGDSHDTRARALTGTGTLTNLSGAAESITWNPDEKQMLFDFRGIVGEKQTDSYIGSGLFSQFSSGTETVRWSAQHAQGLFSVLGDSINRTARDFIGSGSFKKFSGAAESITWNPEEKQMLFSFTGACVVRNTYEFSGSGRLRSFSKIEAEKGTFDYVGSGSLSLKPRKPDVYELRQLSNFTLDFYSLRNGYVNFGDLHFFDQAWTQLGGVYLQWLSLEQGHEKHTEAYNNSACEDAVDLDYGFLVNTNLTNCVANSGVINTNTTATSGCIKVATGTTLAIAPTNTYTIPNQLTTPSVTEDYGSVADGHAPSRDYGWILGTLSKVCPYGLYDIIGNAKTHYVENIITTGYSVTGKAGVTIFGEADTFWTPPYIAQGLGRITGTVGESWTPWIPPGDGLLWSMGGAAETTAQVWQADGLFRISGDGYTLFSLKHFGSGTIRVLGNVGESITPSTEIGSGSLKKFSGAAESTTWNPEEKQLLFSFTGEHEVRFTANPPEQGTEVRISGDAFPVFFIPEYPGSGLIKITGEGDTDRTRAFVGSGSFKKFSGAAESITFNPEEKQLLFSFLGTGTERVTLNPPEEGAEIRLRGEGVFKLDTSYVGSGQISISGDAVSKTTKPFIGSGSLKKFSGAAESITFNPEERRLLFSFTGSSTERISSTPPEGIGVIFSFNGAAETTSVSDDLFGGLFRVDGTSIVRSTISYIGSGSFKKFSGAAESVTFNPDERDMLFSFIGVGEQRTSVSNVGSGSIKIYPEASDYRFSPNFNGSGTARVYGDAGYRFAPVWIGSGTLKKFSGAAESITFNPEEKQLLFSFVGQGSDKTSVSEISKGGTINIDGVAIDKLVPNNIGSGTIFVDGIADTRYTPHVIGSGSLWSWSGAAESFTFNPSDLYTFLKVQGSSPSSKSTIYTGSGSLKKFQGAAESLTFNPDEKQMLFSFLGESATTRSRAESGQGTVKTLGESTVRFSPVYFGSGTARVSGEVYVTRTRDFVGFGSLRKLSGAVEAFTFNPEEKQMLFSFVGEGIQATTSRLISQGGTLAVRGTSGDPLLTFAEQPRVEVDITGDSIDLRSHAYSGSGTISNVNNVDEAFVREGYQGSGQIGPITGFALVAVVVWQPPHTQVWII